jgi:hypothetical protein
MSSEEPTECAISSGAILTAQRNMLELVAEIARYAGESEDDMIESKGQVASRR